MAALDHLVYAVADLDEGCRWLADRTGVVPVIGGAHPGRGTHNALASLGRAYLELIAPDPDQSQPSGPRPFGLDHVSGDGLVAFAVHPQGGDSIDDLVDRSRGHGYDPGPVIEMSRLRPDGVELHWRNTVPPTIDGGVIPFVIDWGSTVTPSTTAPAGIELLSFRVIHPDPGSIAGDLWALGVSADLATGPAAGLSATLRGPSGSVSLRPAILVDR